VLVIGLIDKIIRNSIEVGDVKSFYGAGIGSLVYFCLLCLLIVVGPLVGLCCVKEKCCSLKIMRYLLTLVVASLYYFGDNIDYFALLYGETFNCDKDCQQRLVIVKQVCLGAAILYVHTMPFLDPKPHESEFKRVHYVLNLINMLIKVDMIYSLVTATDILPGGDCSVIKPLSFTLVALATVIGWFAIIWQSIEGARVIYQDNASANCKTCSTFCEVFLLLVSLPLFLLADNQQPLQCGLVGSVLDSRVYGCGNLTVAGDRNDIRNLSIIRLVFTLITAVPVILVLRIVGRKLCSQQEKEENTVV